MSAVRRTGDLNHVAPEPLVGGRPAWTRYPELVPGGLAVALFIAWAATDGGFSIVIQGAGGMFLLALTSLTVFIYRGRLPRLPRPLVAAFLLLAGFTLWSFLSITWADVPSDAWEGANRSLTYLAAFTLFAIVPWSGRSGLIALGVWALGCALTGLAAVAVAAGSTEPILSFVARRFADPTGYHNANAALYSSAFFPALLIASRVEVPALLRGLMLGSAQALVLLALLPQSRGWLIAFPAAALLALAIAPGRARLIVMAVPVALGGALCATPVLDVYTAATEAGAASAGLEAALDHALRTILLGAGAVFAAGVGIGFADRRLPRSPRVSQAGRWAVGTAAATAAIVGIIVAISIIGNPVRWAEDRWNDFAGGEPTEGWEGSRLGGALGSNRYDFWRVAIDAGVERPILGLGAENFAVAYVRERSSDEEPLYPHSLPVKVFSQTGLVGSVLFGGFLACGILVATRALLRAPPLARAAAAAATLSFAYWLAHTSGDWLWAFTGLTAPAFAWLGMAGSLGDHEPANRSEAVHDGPPSGGHRRRAVGAAAILLTAFGAISFGLPAIAARDVDWAAESWGADSDAAYQRLDRAKSLNFLSAEPFLVEGAIASRLGDFERMRSAFGKVLEREPQNWYAHLEIGALSALEGDEGVARAALAEASRLNPREPVIRQVSRRARGGSPMPLKSIDAVFLERVCGRLGATPATEYCDGP